MMCRSCVDDVLLGVPARIRRVKDIESPLAICLSWDLDNVHNHRLVLQENETGEIDVRIGLGFILFC